MKIYGFLFALILPIASFGAPSVRMLGTQPAMISAASPGAKVAPAKVSDTTTGAARTGAVQRNAKSGGAASTTAANPVARFPVISGVRSYKSVKAPQATGSYATATPASVDVEEIVNAVTQKIQNDYYDKNDLYNKQEIDEKFDDPRIDAIRIGSRPSHQTELTNDYVYMWIEEN